MIHLLDVNALVAFGVLEHEFHERVARWVQTNESLIFATCSITELGFVRVVTQTPAYGFSVPQARLLLQRLKQFHAPRFRFVPDIHDASHLPVWVKSPKQITDGHLVRLASASEGVLATLDQRIPGAFVIPS